MTIASRAQTQEMQPPERQPQERPARQVSLPLVQGWTPLVPLEQVLRPPEELAEPQSPSR